MKFGSWVALFTLLSCLHGQGAETTNAPLKFEEIQDLVKGNLAPGGETNLGNAAALGLIRQLSPRVQLLTNSAAVAVTNDSSLFLAKTNVYDDAFAYFRIASVTAGAAEAFQTELNRLSSSNQIKGLLLDLRFAQGDDYEAVGRLADRFMQKEQVLFKWGETAIRSTTKTNAINLPMVALVNSQTTGAPEAFVAVIRQAELGLIIGSATAGQAHLFQDFKLSTGQTLRIARTNVTGADGKALAAIAPDILIQLTLDEEKAYLADPYKVMPRNEASLAGTNLVNGSATNRALRRLNEAELVRRHREGSGDAIMQPDRATGLPMPVINDAALARGLDILKGLSVMQQFRAP